MLVKLTMIEQRYQAVREVLYSGGQDQRCRHPRWVLEVSKQEKIQS
jgi:hypothetical protein